MAQQTMTQQTAASPPALGALEVLCPDPDRLEAVLALVPGVVLDVLEEVPPRPDGSCMQGAHGWRRHAGGQASKKSG